MKNPRRKLKGFLWAIAYILIYEAVSAAVYSAYILYNYLDGSFNFDEIILNAYDSVFELTVISSVVCFWVFMLVGKMRKEPLEKAVRIKKVNRYTIGNAIALAVGCRILVTVYTVLAQNIKPLSDSLEKASLISPDISGVGDILLALFAVVIIGPIFEEILCRGLIMGELMKIMRPWAAIALQAIIFGVVHGVLFQTAFAIVIGVLLGVVYHKSRSIIPSVVCHCVFNVTAVFSAIELNTFMCISGAILGIAICVLAITGLFAETDNE